MLRDHRTPCVEAKLIDLSLGIGDARKPETTKRVLCDVPEAVSRVRRSVEEVTGKPYPGVKKRLDWTRQKVIAEIRRLWNEGSVEYRIHAVKQMARHGLTDQDVETSS